MVGVVTSLEPWVVNGIELATAEWTEIDEGIEVGDRVRVEGRILADGTWLAEEIELLDEDEPIRFEFVGRVSSLNPWIVGGIPLAVDENTEIKGEIVVGDRVKVKGMVLSDGTWLAQKIKRLDRDRGCFSFTTVIRRVDANQFVLFDGQTVTLGEGITVEGQLDVTAVIIISGCVREDGTFIVVTIIDDPGERQPHHSVGHVWQRDHPRQLKLGFHSIGHLDYEYRQWQHYSATVKDDGCRSTGLGIYDMLQAGVGTERG